MIDSRRETSRPFNPAIILLGVAIILGGASQENLTPLCIVELVSIPVLLWSVDQLRISGAWRRHRFSLVILLLAATIPLAQLVPLPPSIWDELPGRAALKTGLKLAGVAQPWLPITLDREATTSNLLALCPPVAMFLATLLTTARRKLEMLSLALGLGAFSIVLGMAQMAAGPTSALYFYDPSHVGLPIGLFSNRNHQAIFLLACLPMASVWARRASVEGRRGMGAAIPLALCGVLIIGVIVTRSRGGAGLLGPAIAASLALAWRGGRGRMGGRLFAIMAGAVVLTMLAAAQFVLLEVLPRFDINQTPELRFETWPQVISVARAYSPFGSGVGTFQLVYPSVEPLSLLQPDFWNHAHNDYLELWLETGWVGVAVMAAFAIWFARAAVSAWTDRVDDDTRLLQCAGVIVIALLLCHSLVDYPLRTEALATLFAFACGLTTVRRTAVAHGVEVSP